MGYDNVARAWPPPSTQEADALKIGFHHLQSDLQAMTGGTCVTTPTQAIGKRLWGLLSLSVLPLTCCTLTNLL